MRKCSGGAREDRKCSGILGLGGISEVLTEDRCDPMLRLGARGRTVLLEAIRSGLLRESLLEFVCSLFWCAAAAAFHFRIDFLTFACLFSPIIEAPAAAPIEPPVELVGDGVLLGSWGAE